MSTEIIDVDAFDPLPVGNLKLDGKSYPVRSILDLEYETYLKFSRCAEHLNAMKDDDDAQMRFLRYLIQQCIPTLPASVLETASVNKVSFIFGRITTLNRAEASGPLATSQPEPS